MLGLHAQASNHPSFLDNNSDLSRPSELTHLMLRDKTVQILIHVFDNTSQRSTLVRSPDHPLALVITLMKCMTALLKEKELYTRRKRGSELQWTQIFSPKTSNRLNLWSNVVTAQLAIQHQKWKISIRCIWSKSLQLKLTTLFQELELELCRTYLPSPRIVLTRSQTVIFHGPKTIILSNKTTLIGSVIFVALDPAMNYQLPTTYVTSIKAWCAIIRFKRLTPIVCWWTITKR